MLELKIYLSKPRNWDRMKSTGRSTYYLHASEAYAKFSFGGGTFNIIIEPASVNRWVVARVR